MPNIGFKDYKILILDECDYITPNANSLRNLMETFSKHCRFILTCNFVERIIDDTKSLSIISDNPPSKKEVAKHVHGTYQRNVMSNVEDLKVLIDSGYPDIRRVINVIMKCCQE